MMGSADKIFKYVLILLCTCTVFASLRYINAQSKWSPIDEFAHMDYVEKVGSGNLPASTDTICEEIFQSIILDTARSTQPNVHTRIELGLGNYSYEAHHPPLYYAILAAPNLVMKKMHWKIFRRVKILRLFSYLLFVTGMLLVVPVFNSLRRLGFAIPAAYAWGCVLFGLLIATNQRFGLGNNMLSPLMINSTLYFLLQYHLKPAARSLYLFVFFCCLSVFAAISNIFIVPVLAVFALRKFRRHFSLKSFFISAFIVAFFALLFYGWKKATPPNAFLEAYIQAGLSYMIPAGKFKYAIFWKLLLEDMATLTFIRGKLDVSFAVAALFAVNAALCLAFIRSALARQSWLIGVTMLFGAFLVCTFLLNKYVAAVYWDAFRHYLGFIPVLYVCCTAFIPVLYAKYGRR